MEDAELRKHLAQIYTTMGDCLSILFKTHLMATATKRALEFDPVLAKRYADYYEEEQWSPHMTAQAEAISLIREAAQKLSV